MDFRTDEELLADILKREDAAIAAENPPSERDMRIGYWIRRMKSWREACVLADTEIALRDALKEEETSCRHAA